MKDIILFTTQTCPYCTQAKTFLTQNKIKFIEKDINKDAAANNELVKRNIKGVPTIFIGDDVVVGLDKEKILKLVDHRIVECPECHTKLRVPINKGKLNVTCPKCKSKIE
jgi:glutaredoxin